MASNGGVIHGHDLPASLQTAQVGGTLPRTSLDAAVGNYEKSLIADALELSRGNRAEAARLLDTTPRAIGYKANKYGIDPDRYRAPSRSPVSTGVQYYKIAVKPAGRQAIRLSGDP